MAGCSKKQYAILMQAGADGKKLASEMGGMEQEAFNKAFSELLGSSGGYNQDDDEDYRDFDPDSDDDYGFDEEDEEYNKEMTAAQNENADMRENEPASVDALYRPDEDKGPRESKGPADPNAPAGQVLYNSDDEEFLKDMGANLKNTQYGRQETLDEYYERVKDKHTDDMDDWKAFISTAYAMSPKEVDRYIKLKESQGREPEDLAKGNPYDPEDLPDEGMSQEELDKQESPKNKRIVVRPHSGIGGDGFDVDVYDGDKLTKTDKYSYGYNASWHETSEKDKPYVTDILQKYADEYGIDMSDFGVEDGKNVFSGKKESGQDFKNRYFKKNDYSFYGQPVNTDSDGKHGSYEKGMDRGRNTKKYKASDLLEALEMLKKDYPDGFGIKSHEGPEGRVEHGQYKEDWINLDELIESMKKGKK